MPLTRPDPTIVWVWDRGWALAYTFRGVHACVHAHTGLEYLFNELATVFDQVCMCMCVCLHVRMSMCVCVRVRVSVSVCVCLSV